MTPLRQRMIEEMQIRNLAPETQRAYLGQISLFARHFGKSPELLGPENIRAYQLYLARDKQLSASSIMVAVASLRFLYKIVLKRDWDVQDLIPGCRKPQKLPVILSRDEVSWFLDAVENLKHRVILTVCYAAGLRISEAVHLTPAAIDRQRMVIRVVAGKGRKDRYVMLSPRLLDILVDYWRQTRPKEWLFPGDRPGQPITTGAVEDACRQVRKDANLAADNTPLAAACLRRSPVGIRHRPAHHPVATRSQRPGHDRPLPASRHQPAVRYHQPAGRFAADLMRHRRSGTCLSRRDASRAGGGGYLPPPRPGVSTGPRRPSRRHRAPRDGGDRGVPHAGAGWACRALCRLRVRSLRL